MKTAMPIDMRSDTVTRPSAAMRERMAAAEVGDDVYGEDPTVNLLQDRVADMLGKEQALFVPSGSMGNQLCIKVHTDPGDEIIAERGSHVFNYETAGAAFLSSVQVYPVAGLRGIMSAEEIRRAIRPLIYYMPRTRLVCIENTHNGAGGVVYPLSVIRETGAVARAEGLRMHLDGARLWNACAATGVSPAAYAAEFDSVSVCLSKGLGAPVGSVIAGNSTFIGTARHFRKLYGGGMRQAGVLCAAGLFALDHNRERLHLDHEHAHLFATIVAGVPGVTVDMATVQTNIVIMNIEGTRKTPAEILGHLKGRGVLLSQGGYGSLRAVTHLDVSAEQVKQAAEEFRSVVALTAG